MAKVDIMEIPWPEETFDVVLCSHVLEHVADDRQALSELYRILRPGGSAIVLVPIDYEREQTLEDESVVSPAERETCSGRRTTSGSTAATSRHGSSRPDSA